MHTCEENNTKCFHIVLPLLYYRAFSLFLNIIEIVKFQPNLSKEKIQ